MSDIELQKAMDHLIDNFFAEKAEETTEEATTTETVVKSDETTATAEATTTTETADEAATEEAATTEATTDTATIEAAATETTEAIATTEATDTETTEKSMKDSQQASGANKTQADEGAAPKKAKKDSSSNGSRSKEISDVPESDEDGSRAKGYESIQSPNSSTPSINSKGTAVKSFQISSEDNELLQKAKVAKEEEVIAKARQEQTDLIKSAVAEATADIKAENESLKKSLDETLTLVKSISKKPRGRKSVSTLQALEKGFAQENGQEQPNTYSIVEMHDAAERLVKSGQWRSETGIELEMTGTLQDRRQQAELEAELKKVAVRSN